MKGKKKAGSKVLTIKSWVKLFKKAFKKDDDTVLALQDAADGTKVLVFTDGRRFGAMTSYDESPQVFPEPKYKFLELGNNQLRTKYLVENAPRK